MQEVYLLGTYGDESSTLQLRFAAWSHRLIDSHAGSCGRQKSTLSIPSHELTYLVIDCKGEDLVVGVLG
jgi:hypothetical protein